jgi:hypothetical protein
MTLPPSAHTLIFPAPPACHFQANISRIDGITTPARRIAELEGAYQIRISEPRVLILGGISISNLRDTGVAGGCALPMGNHVK